MALLKQPHAAVKVAGVAHIRRVNRQEELPVIGNVPAAPTAVLNLHNPEDYHRFPQIKIFTILLSVMVILLLIAARGPKQLFRINGGMGMVCIVAVIYGTFTRVLALHSPRLCPVTLSTGIRLLMVMFI